MFDGLDKPRHIFALFHISNKTSHGNKAEAPGMFFFFLSFFDCFGLDCKNENSTNTQVQDNHCRTLGSQAMLIYL